MRTLVRDPTDELVVFSVPPLIAALPPDLRDDCCYWPMMSVIGSRPMVPLGPVRGVTFQYMTRPGDEDRIEMRHPCAGCRRAVSGAAATLDHPDAGDSTIWVAQCVVVHLGDLSAVTGTFSPLMRPTAAWGRARPDRGLSASRSVTFARLRQVTRTRVTVQIEPA